ncbi:hypothetical protein [Vulcanisaeta souniana]|uniref:hypothetical protein n=1 Tax=Vulcanisaeta souniana TaxID=164452 RepID=UPI0006D29E72|nr:hypothetical protein [Vulcanisaeta souniana]
MKANKTQNGSKAYKLYADFTYHALGNRTYAYYSPPSMYRAEGGVELLRLIGSVWLLGNAFIGPFPSLTVVGGVRKLTVTRAPVNPSELGIDSLPYVGVIGGSGLDREGLLSRYLDLDMVRQDIAAIIEGGKKIISSLANTQRSG